jgi:hypothetical protein
MATSGRRFWICGKTRSSPLGKEWTALSWKVEAEAVDEAEAAEEVTGAAAAVWGADAAGLTVTTIVTAPTTGEASTHTRGNKFPKQKIN